MFYIEPTVLYANYAVLRVIANVFCLMTLNKAPGQTSYIFKGIQSTT